MCNFTFLSVCASAVFFLSGCQTNERSESDNDVFQRLVESHKQYGASIQDWPKHEFQTTQIQPYVIIAPRYSPKIFAPYVKSVTQVANGRFPVFEIETNQGQKISFIRVGVGACNTIDAILALAGTSCKKVIFIGAVGSLSKDADIGDIIVPSKSVCGVGADLYLTTGSFLKNSVIGKSYASDSESSAKLTRLAQRLSTEDGVQVVDKKVCSIDSIIGEYPQIPEMKKIGCDAVEMETATLFHAAKVVNIKATALLYVTDCTLEGQSLYYGRTEESEKRKLKTKKEIIPQVVIEFFQKD